jgi:hypothetical protein
MTFSDLDDAFSELERRADAASDPIGAAGSGYTLRRRRSHAVAIGASAAAIAAIAVGVSFAAAGGGSHHASGAGNPPASSITASVRNSAAGGTGQQSAVSATDVPQTQAALIARFRSILGDTATFTVDSANSTDNLITGVLTSTSGTSGMYVLELYKDTGTCGAVSSVGQQLTTQPCAGTTTLGDGSELTVDSDYPDGPPDGVMNDAILNRPDGWQISLYTANVQGKYYGAPVLGTKPALTVEQVTDIVTSPEWLAN